MATVEEILSDLAVRHFLETNQYAADRIKRAAACLARQPDSTLAENTASLRKLLPSLAEQVIRVFFSYKKKDERAAKTIVELLRENAADKLQVTYQADFGKVIAGKPWREMITKEVRGANWFILLLPDPSDELDWCLFETGLFHAQLTSADRLICLHHPDTAIPSPIEGYHAIAATLPEVEKFLRMVFVEDDPIYGLPPLNRGSEARIPELAQRLVDAIRIPRGRLKHVVFEPWIEIRHDSAKVLKTKDDLDSASVVTANDKALGLFGFIKEQQTFGELRRGIDERSHDSRWREELFHVIRKIANDRVFSPIQAVLRSQNGKTYHPVVLAIDRAGPGGPIETYHITFAEDVATSDPTAMPHGLAVLATLLRFAFRFRWEVLEPYTRGPLSEEEVARLDVSIARIRAEWESRGSLNRDAIREVFTDNQKESLNKMFADWGRLRNTEHNGELDVAIKNKDGKAIPALLRSVLPANQEFLEMAAERFSEMAKEHKPEGIAVPQASQK
jgi:hypothetical protein